LETPERYTARINTAKPAAFALHQLGLQSQLCTMPPTASPAQQGRFLYMSTIAMRYIASAVHAGARVKPRVRVCLLETQPILSLMHGLCHTARKAAAPIVAVRCCETASDDKQCACYHRKLIERTSFTTVVVHAQLVVGQLIRMFLSGFATPDQEFAAFACSTSISCCAEQPGTYTCIRCDAFRPLCR